MNETRMTEESRVSAWKGWHSVLLLGIVSALALIEVLSPPGERLVAWLGIMALLAAFAVIAGQGVTGLWLGVLIDSRNKVSLSRFQMVVWTILILSAFLTAVMVNRDLGQTEPLKVVIPPDLWLLMGISTTSLIGSPLIINAKKKREAKEEEKTSALAALMRQAIDTSKVAILGQIIINQTPEAARWSDMFRGSETGNAGQLDLGKVQMFFFSLILVLAYALALAGLFGEGKGVIDSLPLMDGGMIALLGISHAGYLVNKALPHSEGT